MSTKKSLTRFAVIAGVAAAVTTATLLGQGPGPNPGHPGQHGAKRAELMATALDLTDAQTEQVKSILESTHQSALPLMKQMRESHQAIRDAVKTGASDETLQKLADSQAALVGQLIAIRIKSQVKVYALLTPKQKEKADKFHDLFRGTMGRRFGGGL